MVRVKSPVKTAGIWFPDPALTRLICLAAFVALGMLAGRFCADYWGDSVFGQYLSDFCGLYQEEPTAVSLLSAVRLYFGDVLLAVLLGFSFVGVVGIPLLTLFYGFTAMFAVSCFANIYGRQGVLMAAAAMGIRHLFVLPCFLWAAAWAWTSADRLLSLALGRGKRCSPTAVESGFWYRLGLCVVILLAGLCMELYVTPHLFALMLRA